MFGNGRPLTRKQVLRLTIGLFVLCWATQLLLTQWAHAQELPNEPGVIGTRQVETPAAMPAEKFIAARQTAPLAAGTIELKSEAAVFGSEVRLKQICRWSNADAALFTSIQDLVVLRFNDNTPFKSISMDELKTLLGNAKANLAVMRFSGPLLCTVRRTDNPADPKEALEQWINARQPAGPDTAKPAEKPAEPKAVLAAAHTPAIPEAAVQGSPLRTLRQLLTEDLAVRLRLPADQLQINFNPKDERVLNLPEPQFKFNVEAVRARMLGPVEWNVTVVHDGAVPGTPQILPATQKLTVNANARAWQNQVLATRPLAYKQPILATDLVEKRELVETVSDEPLLTVSQIVGQQASRDIKPGTPMTARMVEAVQLVKTGQYVSVSVNQGAVKIKTVGRAMEAGTFGQVIRVKNEETNDTYQVQLTGPQEGIVGGTMPTETPLVSAGR